MAGASLTPVTPGTLSSMEALIKENYVEGFKDVQIEAGPFASEMIDRAELGHGGRYMFSPIVIGNGGGVGSSLAACFATTSPSYSRVFEVTRATLFAVGEIGSEVMLASEKEEDAYVEAVVIEQDSKRKRLLQLLAFYLIGDGTGTLAQINGTQSTSSTTLTLADAATVVRFQINDVVQIAATVGGAPRVAGTGNAPTLISITTGTSFVGCAYVVGVNFVAGTISLSSTQGGSPEELVSLWQGVTAGDFIYMAGDANTPANSGGSGNAIISGVMAWAPLGGPASDDSFFGVNRYNDSFLYGAVVDATANGLNLGDIRSALVQGVATLHQVSARPDLIVLNPLAFYSLALSMASQGMYTGSRGQGPSDTGSMLFSELELPTPMGTLRVVSDPQMAPFLNPANADPADGYSGAYTALILETESWALLGVAPGDQVPSLERRGGPDGDALMQLIGSDDFFFTLKFYGNLISRAPGHNAVVLCPNS